MAGKRCQTIETGYSCINQQGRWVCATETREVCDYLTPEEVEKELSPQSLDGHRDFYSEVERASFAYALQPYEIRPGEYDIITKEGLPAIRSTTEEAYAILQKRREFPKRQVVWLTLDESTQKRMTEAGQDPNKFLLALRTSIANYFYYSDKEGKYPLNVQIVITPAPPQPPYATVIYTDRKETLVQNRERRIRAVQELLYINQQLTDQLKSNDELQTLMDEVRFKKSDISQEDLYDQVAQAPRFLEILPFDHGLTPRLDEDVGNRDLQDISYVKIDPPNSQRPTERLGYSLVTAHELGHQFGLRHTTRTINEPLEQSIMIDGYVGIYTERTKADIATYQQIVERAFGPEAAQARKVKEISTPAYRFANNDQRYLRFILGVKR